MGQRNIGMFRLDGGNIGGGEEGVSHVIEKANEKASRGDRVWTYHCNFTRTAVMAVASSAQIPTTKI